MVGGNGHRFVFCRDDDSSPGQMVGLSEEPAGTLMDGGYRRFIEDVVRYAADAEVMSQVFVHLAPGDPLKMTPGNDPGRKR